MALDFNQRSFTKTVDQATVDEGLRAYMLKVYNYMTTGLLLTGLVAYFFGKASIVTNELGQIIGITPIGAMLFWLPSEMDSYASSTWICFLFKCKDK